MRELDPLAIALTGTHLIEAAAGTGKTHSLTALFVRLAHATRSGLDVRLRLVPGADGAYRAELAPLAAGRWQIVIEDARGSWRITKEAS